MSKIIMKEIHVYQNTLVRAVLTIHDNYAPVVGDIFEYEYLPQKISLFKITKLLNQQIKPGYVATTFEAIEVRLSLLKKFYCWLLRVWFTFTWPFRRA